MRPHLLLPILLSCALIFSAVEEGVYAANRAAPLLQSVEERINEITSGDPYFYDSFDSDDDTWSTMYDGETSRYFKNGALHISVDVENTVAYAESTLSLANFYLEMETRHYEGSLVNQFGIIFRYVDQDNYYLFGASSDGYYVLQKQIDNEWETLIDWTESSRVEQGEGSVNVLGVLADGPSIALLINGEVVDEIEDDSFDEGSFALAAAAFDEPGVDIAFDSFTLWALPSTKVGSIPILGLPGRRTPTVSGSTPTRTATPTATPEPSPTPTPQASLIPVGDLSIEEIRSLTPLLTDEFSGDEAILWDTEPSQDVEYYYADGAYHIFVANTQILGYTTREDVPVGDFLVELDVSHVSGPIGAEAGLIFRYVDEDNYYLYVISPDGFYGVWKKVDGEWETVLDWVESPLVAVGEGAVNRIGVLAQGSNLTLLVNDEVVEELVDNSHAFGTFGIGVGTFDEPDAEFAFDNMNLWSLDRPLPVETEEVQEENTEPAQDPIASPTVAEATPTVKSVSRPERTIEEIERAIDDLILTDPAYSDDFRRDSGNWTLDSSDDALFTYVGRTFQLTVARTNWLAWSLFSEPASDFFVEVDAEQLAGSPDAGFGLVFRMTDNTNFYIYRITSTGEYSLWKMVAGEWVLLVDWTPSDAIDTAEGAINRIGVWAEGNQLALVVNGTVIDLLSDDSHASGTIGVTAGNFDEPGIEVAFDNFDLWLLTE